MKKKHYGKSFQFEKKEIYELPSQIISEKLTLARALLALASSKLQND